jgi:hypothetical protein
MGSQLPLFGCPKTTKQYVFELPAHTRDVIHRELHRFFERSVPGQSSDAYYEGAVELAHVRNSRLLDHLCRKYSYSDLGIGTIFFLKQLEENKTVYVPKKKGLRTFTTEHLFQTERGTPALFLAELIKRPAQNCDLSFYSPIISELLLKNAGKGNGEKEDLFLSILKMIGIHSRAKIQLRQYRKEVEKGNFGHPIYVPTNSGSMRSVTRQDKEKMKKTLLQRIDRMVVISR